MKLYIIFYGRKVFEIALLVQFVDHNYVVVRVMLPQIMDEVRADKTGAACDEDLLHISEPLYLRFVIIPT